MVKPISAEEFDRRFDDGEDMSDYINWSSVRRPGREQASLEQASLEQAGLEPKRVNVDFPQWMIAGLDREAKRRGVTRQALIKMWISDRLDATAA